MPFTSRLLVSGAALVAWLALLAAPVLAQSDAAPAPAPAPAPASATVEQPTQEQIRTAYAETLDGVNERTTAIMGGEDGATLTVVLEDLTKLGCRELNRPGAQFDCRVERRIRHGQLRPKTDVGQLWLSSENDRWVVR